MTIVLDTADINMNIRGGTTKEGADIYTPGFNVLHYSAMNATIEMCGQCRAGDMHKAEL